MTATPRIRSIRSRHVAGQLPASHYRALYEAFSQLKGTDEIRRFLRDVCTLEEIDAMAERWQIACQLDAGNQSYRQIHDRIGVSTTTIGRVARFLLQEPHQGYRLVLDRIKKRKKN